MGRPTNGAAAMQIGTDFHHIPYDKEWKQPPRMVNRVPNDVEQFYLPYVVHHNLAAAAVD